MLFVFMKNKAIAFSDETKWWFVFLFVCLFLSTGQNVEDIEKDKYVSTSSNQTTVQTLAKSTRKKGEGKLNTPSARRAHANYVLIDWVGGPDGKIFGPRSWRTDRA